MPVGSKWLDLHRVDLGKKGYEVNFQEDQEEQKPPLKMGFISSENESCIMTDTPSTGGALVLILSLCDLNYLPYRVLVKPVHISLQIPRRSEN